MGRKNRNPHPPRTADITDRYDIDYVFLTNAPEIAAVVVPEMKTIYRNMCCATWADEVHEVRGDDDKYLKMIRQVI